MSRKGNKKIIVIEGGNLIDATPLNITANQGEKPSMKQQTTPFPEKAATHFKQGYNCAQSVLLIMQEYYNYKNELIPKIATAFGAGIGRRGSLCGALTGAIMAIGLEHGTDEPILEKRERAYRLAQKFFERFAQECGSAYCRELIGYDLTKPEELEKARELNVFDEKCSFFVKKAVEMLIDLEAKNL